MNYESIGKAFLKDAKLYQKSVHKAEGCTAFVIDAGDRDVLIATEGCGFTGTPFRKGFKKWVACEENHENAVALRKNFKFTAPIPALRKERTVGTGDRLGIATPGHVRVFEKYDAYPILAQQSIRELNLTNRTFDDVLDSASYSVFREDFTRGFGADGDHLKKAEELEYALGCGYTMITLDCSEHIHNEVMKLSDDEIRAAYVKNEALEEKYLGKTVTIDGIEISFDEISFKRNCLIYNEAIDFAVEIFHRFFDGRDDLDFEMSIDETETPTTPAQHYYIANELISRGVKVVTIAPRFVGEFQKGIDYIGELSQFKKEFEEHAKIAKHFGYKISVHSGSDKFSVFETVGKFTNGNFHLKTAGTNWLEAMAIIAEHDPALYREIHQYALDYAFSQATAYYHVTTDLTRIPALETLADAELPELFKNNDSRQLIHITYGLILNEKNADGSFRFKDRLYADWRKYADEYAGKIEHHIGRHLELLYKGFGK